LRPAGRLIRDLAGDEPIGRVHIDPWMRVAKEQPVTPPAWMNPIHLPAELVDARALGTGSYQRRGVSKELSTIVQMTMRVEDSIRDKRLELALEQLPI